MQVQNKAKSNACRPNKQTNTQVWPSCSRVTDPWASPAAGCLANRPSSPHAQAGLSPADGPSSRPHGQFGHSPAPAASHPWPRPATSLACWFLFLPRVRASRAQLQLLHAVCTRWPAQSFLLSHAWPSTMKSVFPSCMNGRPAFHAPVCSIPMLACAPNRHQRVRKIQPPASLTRTRSSSSQAATAPALPSHASLDVPQHAPCTTQFLFALEIKLVTQASICPLAYKQGRTKVKPAAFCHTSPSPAATCV